MNIVSPFFFATNGIRSRRNDWFFLHLIQRFFRVRVWYVWHDVNKDTFDISRPVTLSFLEKTKRNVITRWIIPSNNTEATYLRYPSKRLVRIPEWMDIFGYRVGFDLSKGKIPRFRESNPIVTSDRNDSRAKPRSRHSSSRLNYDHGHYSGQTRLSVSTRPSRLLLSRPFREKRRVFVLGYRLGYLGDVVAPDIVLSNMTGRGGRVKAQIRR